MSLTLKPIGEQTIVITGASSGIGLAAARLAAKQGARLVLAARNEDALAAIERGLSDAGAEVAHVAADVGRREDVQRIADTAIERFGGFDTWVNDAGVSIYGRLEEVSEEDHRRLFETNFWGVVHGSLIAVQHLKNRGGALINLGSVLSDMGAPIQAMYAASKHAVKGFTDSLRMELEHEDAPVSVTLIKPTSIDTPFTEHAKKYTQGQPNLPPPVYEADEVARAIVFAAAHPKRDIFVGSSAKAMSLTARNAPGLGDLMGSRFMYKQQVRAEPARNRGGSLHRAGTDGRVKGDYPGYVMKRSFYSRASRHPVLTGLAVAAVGATAYSMARRRKT